MSASFNITKVSVLKIHYSL